MLQVGDRVKVHGFVMLKGLDGGRSYLVDSDRPYYGKKTYTFRRILKNGKPSWHDMCRHYAEDVECWMNPLNNNRIERLEV